MDKNLLDMLKINETVALIPARGGSKTVPRKNIRLFMEHPLIAYSIAAAKLSQKINRIIVSTDSDEIAGISKKYGAEVPFLRPAELARDESPDIDFVKHAILWFAEHEKKIPEYLVHLRPTTPIRSYKVLDKAIHLISQDKFASSMRSASVCIHPPYKWFVKGQDNYMEPLIKGMSCDEINLPRQNFPIVYMPNGYIDILKSKYVIQTNLMHGDRMIGFETGEIPDIDTEEDLYKLQFYEEHQGTLNELKRYLDSFN